MLTLSLQMYLGEHKKQQETRITNQQNKHVSTAALNVHNSPQFHIITAHQGQPMSFMRPGSLCTNFAREGPSPGSSFYAPFFCPSAVLNHRMLSLEQGQCAQVFTATSADGTKASMGMPQPGDGLNTETWNKHLAQCQSNKDSVSPTRSATL